MRGERILDKVRSLLRASFRGKARTLKYAAAVPVRTTSAVIGLARFARRQECHRASSTLLPAEDRGKRQRKRLIFLGVGARSGQPGAFRAVQAIQALSRLRFAKYLILLAIQR